MNASSLDEIFQHHRLNTTSVADEDSLVKASCRLAEVVVQKNCYGGSHTFRYIPQSGKTGYCRKWNGVMQLDNIDR